MINTTSKGDLFESAVYDYFVTQLNEGRLGLRSECCKVFRKKGYYSRDRERNIIFDVSIEIYMPGQTEYSSVWLIECKNYSGQVPVSDVEEFFAKVEQVAAGNGKAILAGNSPFDAGGVTYARNKRMGIIRFIDSSSAKWELLRSPSAGVRSVSADEAERVLSGLSTQEIDSGGFDLYMQCPAGPTNSLWDFTNSMLSESGLTEAQLATIRLARRRPKGLVPYVTLEQLEKKSAALLSDLAYRGGPVPLDEICSREAKKSGLKVARDVSLINESATLGRISFVPLEISIYRQPVPNLGRERFTLAHELAHHLLCHGKYMASETCDEGDFALRRGGTALAPDVDRMEFQANVYASCLLMPKAYFENDFRGIVRWLGIPNRGFGELYLDGQLCNYQNYERVTRELMKRYSISRAAATIRLESLGLLRDVRAETWQSPKSWMLMRDGLGAI